MHDFCAFTDIMLKCVMLKPESVISFIDCVPPGTFRHGDYSPERVAAVRAVQRIGRALAMRYPDIHQLYADPQTRYIDIARQRIPRLTARNPGLAEKVVGHAVRLTSDPLVQARLTAARRARILDRNMGERGTAQYSKHQSHAARIRHERGIPVDIAAMTAGRGITPWSAGATSLVQNLSINPEFQRRDYRGKIVPDCAKIAQALNERFHPGNSPRTPRSVYDVLRDLGRGIKRG